MTDAQVKHIMRIIEAFKSESYPKFERGAKEHGGSLEDMPLYTLLINLRDEVIDSFVYLQTAIEKLEKESGKA